MSFASESRRVSSFGAAMEKVETRFSMAELREESYLIDEIGRVIADVWARDDESYAMIDGSVMNFRYLGEVYEELTDDHLRLVAEQVENYPREIRFKKAFIRTALYNSVFEMNTDVANKIRNAK